MGRFCRSPAESRLLVGLERAVEIHQAGDIAQVGHDAARQALEFGQVRPLD
jgi:hypothetical protein